MNDPSRALVDPELDLVLERVADVPPGLIWKAWTRPEHLKEWFVPRPWTITECEIDLRPGGVFRMVMRPPDGEATGGDPGCYLEVVEGQRFSWTNALRPGFRPATSDPSDIVFTAEITIEPHGNGGTRYVARVMHRDPEGRTRHQEMGFYEGWGTCFDQLEELVRGWEGGG